MTMAKGVANGMPLGGHASPRRRSRTRSQKLTISTFGGNPMSCAAANATLAVIEEEDLCGNAETQGARLREGLVALQAAHPGLIGDVRGLGLMQALELVVDETAGDRTPNPEATAKLFEETKKRGLLIGKGGLHGNVIRIAPPLTVGADEIDEALAALRESFAALEG